MQWTGERNGHSTLIKEVGGDTIVVSCESCAVVLGRLTKEEFPKWRIAFNKANVLVREHSC